MANLQATPGQHLSDIEDALDPWLFDSAQVTHVNANLAAMQALLEGYGVTRHVGGDAGSMSDEPIDGAGKFPVVHFAINEFESVPDTSNTMRWRITINFKVWAQDDYSGAAVETGFAIVRDIAACICSMLCQMHRNQGAGDFDTYVSQAEPAEFSPVFVRYSRNDEEALIYNAEFSVSWYLSEALAY